MLARNPAFTCVVVLILALGIGANTAIFTIVNAVLVQPLPYPESDQLVRIKKLWPPGHALEFFGGAVPRELYSTWKEQAGTLSRIACHAGIEATLTGGEYPERITCGRVSADFFPLLGILPAMGRGFDPTEDRANGPPVAVVSHGLWQRRLGSRVDAIGEGITLDGKSHTVVGVLPTGFQFPDPAEIYLPMGQAPRNFFSVIGRLKPGHTARQVSAELDGILHRLPGTDPKEGVRIVGLQEDMTENVRLTLLVLQAVVGLVLLIACADVANLLLARAMSRRKEIATRAALGASRVCILRLLWTENSSLALVGGGLGLLLAGSAMGALRATTTSVIPAMCPIRLDVSVLGFTLLISLLTSVLGLLPALNSTRLDLTEALKPGSAGSTTYRRGPRLHDVLVVSEVALTLILLIGAGLLTKSLLRLQSVNLGFRPEGVLMAKIDAPWKYTSTETEAVSFFERLFERIHALPGVEAVSVADFLPMMDFGRQASLSELKGLDTLLLSRDTYIPFATVSSEYFRALGIPLLQGRWFNSADTKDSAKVALVNETLVRLFFPHGDATGRSFQGGPAGPESSWTIVGVVADARQSRLDRDVLPQIYLPYTQMVLSDPRLVLRTTGEPQELVRALRDVLKSMEAELPVYDLMTLEQRMARFIVPRRVNMLLTSTFAALALLLAVGGIYGLMSHLVSQRTHEIGVRMALGAWSGDILKAVVGKGLRLALIGTGLGLAAALGLTRIIVSLLYDVSPTDPLTLMLVSLILIGVAALASWVPARRAAKIDPMEALRYE